MSDKIEGIINPEMKGLKNPLSQDEMNALDFSESKATESEKPNSNTAPVAKEKLSQEEMNSLDFSNAESVEHTYDRNQYGRIKDAVDLKLANTEEFAKDDNSDYSTAEQRWIFDARKNLPKEELEAGMAVFDKANSGFRTGDYYFDPQTYAPVTLEEGEQAPINPTTGMAMQIFGDSAFDRFLSGFTNGAIAGGSIAGAAAGIPTLGFGAIPGAAVGALAGGLTLGIANALVEDDDYLPYREGNDVSDDGKWTTAAKVFNNTLLTSSTNAVALLKVASEGIMGNETYFSDLYESIKKNSGQSGMAINPMVPQDFQTEKAWNSTAEFFNAENYNFDAIPIMIGQGLASAAQYIGAGVGLKAIGKTAGKYAGKKVTTEAAKKAAAAMASRKAGFERLAKRALSKGDDAAAKALWKKAAEVGSEKMSNAMYQLGAGMILNNSEIMAQLEEVEGLSIRERSAYALMATVGMSAIEMIGGPDNAMLRRALKKNGIDKSIRSEVVDEVTRLTKMRAAKGESTNAITGEMLKKIHDRAYKTGLKGVVAGGKDLLSNGLSEGTEELLQTAWQDAAGQMANSYYDLDDDEGFNADMASPETWTAYFNSFAAGFMVGGTMSAPGAVGKAASGRIASAMSMAEIVENDKKKAGYENDIARDLKHGKITEEQAQKARTVLSTFEAFNTEIMGIGLTKGQKKDAFVHMGEMKNIEENHDIENLPKAVQKKYDEHSKEFDAILEKAGIEDARKVKAKEAKLEKKVEKEKAKAKEKKDKSDLKEKVRRDGLTDEERKEEDDQVEAEKEAEENNFEVDEEDFEFTDELENEQWRKEALRELKNEDLSKEELVKRTDEINDEYDASAEEIMSKKKNKVKFTEELENEQWRREALRELKNEDLSKEELVKRTDEINDEYDATQKKITEEILKKKEEILKKKKESDEVVEEVNLKQEKEVLDTSVPSAVNKKIKESSETRQESNKFIQTLDYLTEDQKQELSTRLNNTVIIEDRQSILREAVESQKKKEYPVQANGARYKVEKDKDGNNVYKSSTGKTISEYTTRKEFGTNKRKKIRNAAWSAINKQVTNNWSDAQIKADRKKKLKAAFSMGSPTEALGLALEYFASGRKISKGKNIKTGDSTWAINKNKKNSESTAEDIEENIDVEIGLNDTFNALNEVANEYGSLEEVQDAYIRYMGSDREGENEQLPSQQETELTDSEYALLVSVSAEGEMTEEEEEAYYEKAYSELIENLKPSEREKIKGQYDEDNRQNDIDRGSESDTSESVQEGNEEGSSKTTASEINKALEIWNNWKNGDVKNKSSRPAEVQKAMDLLIAEGRIKVSKKENSSKPKPKPKGGGISAIRLTEEQKKSISEKYDVTIEDNIKGMPEVTANEKGKEGLVKVESAKAEIRDILYPKKKDTKTYNGKKRSGTTERVLKPSTEEQRIALEAIESNKSSLTYDPLLTKEGEEKLNEDGEVVKVYRRKSDNKILGGITGSKGISKVKKAFEKLKLAITLASRNLKEGEEAAADSPIVLQTLENWKFRTESGTTIHDMSQDLINGKTSKQFIADLAGIKDKKDRQELEKAMLSVRKFVNELTKDGGILIAEAPIYDERTGLVMVADILRVNTDGTTDIFDYKVKKTSHANKAKFDTQEQSNDGNGATYIGALNGVPQSSSSDHALQLMSIKRALERQGITVGKTEIVPVGATFTTRPMGNGEFDSQMQNVTVKEPHDVSDVLTEEDLDAFENSIAQAEGNPNSAVTPTFAGTSKSSRAEVSELNSKEELERIKKDNPQLAGVIDAMLSKQKAMGTRIAVVSEEEIDGAEGEASYSLEGGQMLTDVAVALDIVRDSKDVNSPNKKTADSVIVHEEIHRYTAIILNIYEQGYTHLLSPSELAFAESMTELYNIYKQTGDSKFPQVVDVKEFVAYGLSNKAFIKHLKGIKIGDASLFERILQAIKSLLGNNQNVADGVDAVFKEFMGLDSPQINSLKQHQFYKPVVSAGNQSEILVGESIEAFVERSTPIAVGITYGTNKFDVYPGNIIIGKNKTREMYVDTQGVRDQILGRAGLVQNRYSPNVKVGVKESVQRKIEVYKGKVTEPNQTLIKALERRNAIVGKLVLKNGVYYLEREKSTITLGKLFGQAADFKNQEVSLRLIKKADWNQDGSITHKNGTPYGDRIDVISPTQQVIGGVNVSTGEETIITKSEVDEEGNTYTQGDTGAEQRKALEQGNADVEVETVKSDAQIMIENFLGEDSFISSDISKEAKQSANQDYINGVIDRNTFSGVSKHIGQGPKSLLFIEGDKVVRQRIKDGNSYAKAVQAAWKKIKEWSKEKAISISPKDEVIWRQAMLDSENNTGSVKGWQTYVDKLEREWDPTKQDNPNNSWSEVSKADGFRNSSAIRRLYEGVKNHHPQDVYNEVYDVVHGKNSTEDMDAMLSHMMEMGGVVGDFADNMKENFTIGDMVSLVNVIRSQKRRPQVSLFIRQRAGKNKNKQTIKTSRWKSVNDTDRVKYALLGIISERRSRLKKMGVEWDGKSEKAIYTRYENRIEKIRELAKEWNSNRGATKRIIDGKEEWYINHYNSKTKKREQYTLNDIATMQIKIESKLLEDLTGLNEKTIMQWVQSKPGHENIIGAMTSSKKEGFIQDYQSKGKPVLSIYYITPIHQSFFGHTKGYKTFDEFYSNAYNLLTGAFSNVFKDGTYADKFQNEEGNLKSSSPVQSWALDRMDNALDIPVDSFNEGNSLLNYYRSNKKMSIPTFIVSGIKDMTAKIGKSGKNISPEDIRLMEFMGFVDTANDILLKDEYLQSAGQFADKSMMFMVPVQKYKTESFLAEIKKIRESNHPNSKYFPTDAELKEEIDEMTELVKSWIGDNTIGSDMKEEIALNPRNFVRDYVVNNAVNGYYLDQVIFGRRDNYANMPMPIKEDFKTDKEFQRAYDKFIAKANSGKAKRAGSMGSGGVAPNTSIKGGLEATYNQVIVRDTATSIILDDGTPNGKLLTEEFENGDGIMFQSPRHEAQTQVSFGDALDMKNSSKVLYAAVDSSNNPILDKLHRITLTKEMVDLNPEKLGPVWDAMNRKENPLDTFVFTSGAKQFEQVDDAGNPVDVITDIEYDDNGHIKNFEINEDKIVTRESKNLRLQQNLNNDGLRKDKRLIPQMMRHLKRLIGNSTIDALVADHLEEKTADFLHEIDYMGPSEKRQFLLDTMDDTEANAEIRELLQAGASVDYNMISRYISSTIGSALQKNVLDMNSKGSLLTTISDMILKEPLLGPRIGKNKDGKRVTLPGQVMVTEASGYAVGDKLFITRMPCDDLHSIGYVEVVGHLPDSMGNKIMVDKITRHIAGEDQDGDQRHVWGENKKALYVDPNSKMAATKLLGKNIYSAKMNALQNMFPDNWKYFAANQNDIFIQAPRFEGSVEEGQGVAMQAYENELNEYLEEFFEKRDPEQYRSETSIPGMKFGPYRYSESFVNTTDSIVQKIFSKTEAKYRNVSNFAEITHEVDTDRLNKYLNESKTDKMNSFLSSYSENVYDSNRSTAGSGSVIGVVAKSVATFIEIIGNNFQFGSPKNLEYTRKQREIFTLLGDALNQATDNAKQQKLARMNLTNENSGEWLAMAMQGKGIEEIIAFFENPIVKKYYAAVLSQSLLSDTSVQEGTYTNQLLADALPDIALSIKREFYDKSTEKFKELEILLEVSSELFKFGQIMNVSEGGVKNWPELVMAKQNYNKAMGYVDGKEFSHIEIDPNSKLMQNIGSAIEAAELSLGKFSLMNTLKAKQMAMQIKMAIGAFEYSRASAQAIERIVQTKLMEEAFPEKRSETTIKKAIDDAMALIDQNEYDYFEYVNEGYTQKGVAEYGIVKPLRHNTDPAAMNKARIAFEKLPNSLQDLLLEYNSVKYGDSYATKSGAFTRTIGIAKNLEYHSRIDEAKKLWANEDTFTLLNKEELKEVILNHTKAAVNGYANHIIPVDTTKGKGPFVKKVDDVKMSLLFVRASSSVASDIIEVGANGLQVGKTESVWKHIEKGPTALADVAAKVEESSTLNGDLIALTKKGTLDQDQKVIDAVPEIWESMKNKPSYKNLKFKEINGKSIGSGKAKKLLSGEETTEDISVNIALLNFWKEYSQQEAPPSFGGKSKSVRSNAKSAGKGIKNILTHINEFTNNNTRALINNLKSNEEIRSSLIKTLKKLGVENVNLATLSVDDLANLWSYEFRKGSKEVKNEISSKGLDGSWRDWMYNYFYNKAETKGDDSKFETVFKIQSEIDKEDYDVLKARLSFFLKKLKNKPSKANKEVFLKAVEKIEEEIKEIEKDPKNQVQKVAAAPMAKHDFMEFLFGEVAAQGQESNLSAERQKQLDYEYDKYVEEWGRVQAYFDSNGYLGSEERLNERIESMVLDGMTRTEAIEEMILGLRKSYQTKAVEFPLFILQDRLAREQIVSIIQDENTWDSDNRNHATRALYDMITILDNRNEDWGSSPLQSGKYSIKSPSRLGESILQLNEMLIRRKLRDSQRESRDLGAAFKKKYQEIKDADGNIRDLIGKTETKKGVTTEYFISKGGVEYNALESKAQQGDKAAKALLQLLNMHLDQEAKTGDYSYSQAEKAYRVPQVEEDFFTLFFQGVSFKKDGAKAIAKLFKNPDAVKAFKSGLISQQHLDKIKINPLLIKDANGKLDKKYNINATMSYGEMKIQLTKKLSDVDSTASIGQNIEIYGLLRKLQNRAELLATKGVDDAGAATQLGRVEKINPSVGFSKTDTTTNRIEGALTKHHEGMIRKKNFEVIEATMKYLEGHLERTHFANQANWLKLRNDEMLYQKGFESAFNQRLEKFIDNMAGLAYWQMLGFNWLGAIPNAAAGLVTSFRELKGKTMAIGFARMLKFEVSLNGNVSDSKVHNSAIMLMKKFEIVAVSKDTEMNITDKNMARISNIGMANIVIPEYLNHAYSFIGRITKEEWARLEIVLREDGTLEEITIAMVAPDGYNIKTMTAEKKRQYLIQGARRIDELQETTQQINGAYSDTSKRFFNKTAEGRILMMMKNWFPEQYLAHWSPEFKDLYDVNRKGIINSAVDVTKTLHTMDGWKALVYVFKDQLPGELTPQEKSIALSEVDRANVIKLLKEVGILAGMAITFAMLFGDDDEELSKEGRIAKDLYSRILEDTKLVYNPMTYVKLVENPIPMASTLKSIVNLSYNILIEPRAVYETSNNSVEKGDLKLTNNLGKFIPLVSGGKRTFNTLSGVYEYANQ